MKHQNFKKLKKYLFFISILFFVFTFIHLVYSYVHSESKTIPKTGGSISEWLVWNFPSFNPLKNLQGNNKYVVDFLYRSILTFDIDQNKVVGDIANCDISVLTNIECVINNTAKWSDGTQISGEDVFATYQLIKETKSNQLISSLLESTEIEYNKNILVFKSSKKDINILNVFFQPIVNKKIIDSLSEENITGSFPSENGIYSGKYVLDSIKTNENLWIRQIVLKKNPEYDEVNISTITLSIFPDINSLTKNKQTINVYNDSNNIIWESIARLESYKYILPQFVWIFLNTDTITSTDLRSHILKNINPTNLVKLLWEKNYEVVNNVFFSERERPFLANNKNFESVMAGLGYKKKAEILKQLKSDADKKSEKKETEENKNTELTAKTYSFDDIQQDSKYITSPEYVDLYNFVSKDDILLKWKVEKENVDAVYINDYKLQNFKPNEKEFFYRLRVSYDSIKVWENSYEIAFEKNGKKEKKETIVFLYNPDKKALSDAKESYINKLVEAKNTQEKEKIIAQNKENKEKKEEKQAVKTLNIDKALLQQVNNLDENLYYNAKFEPFTLNIYYLNSRPDYQKTVWFISENLKEIWINTLETGFGINELWKVLSEKNKYDILLTGVYLWYFEHNLFPFLHSSQAENRNNYAKLKKTSLDLLLEELKEKVLTPEQVLEIRKKISKILDEESALKTLYTPKNNLLIDKNIKVEKTYNFLPSKYARSNIIESSYVKKEEIINIKWKSMSWFLRFIFKSLYE